MTVPMSLTFHGSYFELFGWILVAALYLSIAFAAGWFVHAWKRGADK